MPLLLPAPGQRKAAIVALTPQSALAAEIGADHGIISAHLLKGNVCERMIVSDISAASLSKARRLFALHGLTDRALFRGADGLMAISEPVGAILVAGMGARTMIDMLETGFTRIGEATLVLQPNTDHAMLRGWLMVHGFYVDAERLAHEGRRYYIILRARHGEEQYTKKELFLGPCLLRERPDGWPAYLAWRQGCLASVKGRDQEQALAWIEEEIARYGDQVAPKRKRSG